MGIVFLVISSTLATTALLVFVTYFSYLPTFSAFLWAIILWSPSTWMFAKAQTKVKDLATALIVFSVAAALTDTLGGLIFQQTPIKNFITLFLGLGTGIIVITLGARAKNLDQPQVRREIFLYGVGLIGLIATVTFKNIWYALVGLYALADLIGGTLSLRLLTFIPKETKLSSFYEFDIGIISFAPITFVSIHLLKILSNVVIAGPSATIMSCGLAMVGAKWLTKKPIIFTDILFLMFSVVAVLLIYFSF